MARHAVALHPLGGVYGVAPDVVDKFVSAEHAGNQRAGVEANAKLEPLAEGPAGRCQINSSGSKGARSRMRDHAAATAFRHSLAASALKIRSVDRETRWRCRLKVLWTAACMLRKRWANRADLKRCILRSRRRTG